MVEQVRDETVFTHAMFAESLLDTSWTQQTRRGYTTLTSFGLQAIVVSLLLLMPLLRTVVLPAVRTVSTPIRMGRAAPMPLAPRPHSGGLPVTANGPTFPRYLPRGAGSHEPTVSTGDDSAPQIGGGDDGAPGIGIPSAPDISLVTSGKWQMPPPPGSPKSRTFRTSKMLEGSLYHRVQPIYPPLARAARIQGEVVLAATISKDGMIENLQVFRGHPMLVTAAIEAVHQWRYRPYILNNEPVEVETQITVNFTLAGN